MAGKEIIRRCAGKPEDLARFIGARQVPGFRRDDRQPHRDDLHRLLAGPAPGGVVLLVAVQHPRRGLRILRESLPEFFCDTQLVEDNLHEAPLPGTVCRDVRKERPIFNTRWHYLANRQTTNCQFEACQTKSTQFVKHETGAPGTIPNHNLHGSFHQSSSEREVVSTWNPPMYRVKCALHDTFSVWGVSLQRL